MRFQVPQFIDVEDKVFGPFTFKQFVYIAGGAGLSFLIYTLLPLILAIPLIGAAIALSLALAFYKVNNKPFVFFIESSFKYIVGNKLYVWRKEQKAPKQKEPAEEKSVSSIYVPRLSDSKLKDIAWSLDIHQEANDT